MVNTALPGYYLLPAAGRLCNAGAAATFKFVKISPTAPRVWVKVGILTEGEAKHATDTGSEI